MTISQQQGFTMLYTNSKNGFALSIVMWIVAALLLGIALVLGFSKNSLTLTKGVQDKLAARLEAQNYLAVVKYYVLTANYNNFELINKSPISKYKLPKKIVLNGRDYNLSKNVTLSMKDASSMINLFYPNAQMIAALASQGNATLYYTIKDSILDWTDANSKVRLDGAENNYYKQKNVLYRPRNYPTLQSIEELRLIRGINTLPPNRFNRLKKYLYSSQHGAAVDLALINANYMSKLLHMDKATAQKLISYKYTNYTKFVKIIRKNHYYDYNFMGFAPSFNILIKIKVKVGDAKVFLEAFVDFRKNKFRRITTHLYKIY